MHDMTKHKLIQLLQRVILKNQDLARYSSFREDRYSRNIVVRDRSFEVLVICWKSGQRSLIHDHGKSLGAVKVLRGILTESLFTRSPNGMIKPTMSADYRSGDVQIEEQSTIHQVSNLQPAPCDAISLHIYLPPLSNMNIYRLHDVYAGFESAELHNYGSGI
jgi:cysteine dioxygenase